MVKAIKAFILLEKAIPTLHRGGIPYEANGGLMTLLCKTVGGCPKKWQKACYRLSLTGFTLLEFLIAIAIIVIIVGIIAPQFDMGLKNQRLDADSKELASNVTLAQQYAIGQKDSHRYYGVVFYNGGYRIVPYSDPYTPLNPIWVPSSENINGDIPFSEGINISGEQNIIFDSRGSTLLPNDIQIILSCDSSTRKITVTHLTGHVAIE